MHVFRPAWPDSCRLVFADGRGVDEVLKDWHCKADYTSLQAQIIPWPFCDLIVKQCFFSTLMLARMHNLKHLFANGVNAIGKDWVQDVEKVHRRVCSCRGPCDDCLVLFCFSRCLRPRSTPPQTASPQGIFAWCHCVIQCPRCCRCCWCCWLFVSCVMPSAHAYACPFICPPFLFLPTR